MIVVERVSKEYPVRGGHHRVLKSVSLVLERGRNVGILGRNGAGKSTLIRLLAGAEQPTSGRIHRGMSVSWPRAFGGAFQTHLTGLDNLKFVCRLYGVNWSEKLPFVEDFTELGRFLREPVLHYSHGMLTRLAAAGGQGGELQIVDVREPEGRRHTYRLTPPLCRPRIEPETRT